MANMFFEAGKQALLETVRIGTENLKLMLVDDTYSPSQSHTDMSSIDSYEISGTGYTQYGQAVSGESISTGSGYATVDASDITWTDLDAGTIGGAVLYYDSGGARSTCIPIVFFDPSNLTTNGSDVIAEFSTSGAFRI